MRFTDGLWMHRSGLSIHNTHQMWEYRIEQDRIKAFVLCHCVEEADDYTAVTDPFAEKKTIFQQPSMFVIWWTKPLSSAACKMCMAS